MKICQWAYFLLALLPRLKLQIIPTVEPTITPSELPTKSPTQVSRQHVQLCGVHEPWIILIITHPTCVLFCTQFPTVSPTFITLQPTISPTISPTLVTEEPTQVSAVGKAFNCVALLYPEFSSFTYSQLTFFFKRSHRQCHQRISHLNQQYRLQIHQLM